MKIENFVSYKDIAKKLPKPKFGLLLDDGNIICLCCGGIVKPEEYEITEVHGRGALYYAHKAIEEDF